MDRFGFFRKPLPLGSDGRLLPASLQGLPSVLACVLTSSFYKNISQDFILLFITLNVYLNAVIFRKVLEVKRDGYHNTYSTESGN